MGTMEKSDITWKQQPRDKFVTAQFHHFLTMMEDAFSELTKSEFRLLEEKIKKEIAYHRRKKARTAPEGK